MSLVFPTRWLRRFARNEDGNVAIETIIILPVLFWVYLTMYVIFDAYRQHALAEKAAYTIGDVISRQTTPIDGAYLAGTQGLLGYLTRNRDQSPSLRVTLIRYDADYDSFTQDWSKTRGADILSLTNTDIKDWHDKLPVLLHNERIIVVETFVNYTPPFNTGMPDMQIRNFVFTRPRYSPQVLWSAG